MHVMRVRHAHLDPESQAVEDEMTGDGVIAVEGVATSRVVVVLAFWRQHVVGAVVYAAEGDVRPFLIPFCCVVEHHIQNHFNATLMCFPDQRLELICHRLA